jgi:hypothetical protein
VQVCGEEAAGQEAMEPIMGKCCYMNDSLITHPYVSAYYYICVRILVYM